MRCEVCFEISKPCPLCGKEVDWNDYCNKRKTKEIEEFTFYCGDCDEEFNVDVEVKRKEFVSEKIHLA